MTLPLAGKTTLVTGASRGIGKAIALKLAQSGAKVLCISQSNASEQVAESILQAGGNAKAYSVDVSQGQAVISLCNQLLEEHGQINILVNNAGITRDNLMLRMSLDEWHSVINTNLSSVFYWTKGLLKSMVSNRSGRIINIASVIGLVGNPGQANYAAAKAGIFGITKTTAKEVASRGITVNAIAPGFIQSDMTASLPDKIKEHIMNTIPMKRMGIPEDIAQIVDFLASDNAAYITGQVFPVDGGMVM